MSNIEGHSVEDIIQSISDSKSLDLFCSNCQTKRTTSSIETNKRSNEKAVLFAHQPIIETRTNPEKQR